MQRNITHSYTHARYFQSASIYRMKEKKSKETKTMVSKEEARKDISPETVTEPAVTEQQHLIYHTDMRFTTFADKKIHIIQHPYD